MLARLFGSQDRSTIHYNKENIIKDNRCTIEKTLIAPKDNGTRTEALQKLFDNPDKRVLAKNLRDEIPVFQFYINVAIRNIQDIAGTVVGTQDFAPDKIVEKLTPDGKLYENQSQDKKEAVRRAVEKLADFSGSSK